MISTQRSSVRQIFLNRQHSENVKQSSFGEFVSHYEPVRFVKIHRGHAKRRSSRIIERLKGMREVVRPIIRLALLTAVLASRQGPRTSFR